MADTVDRESLHRIIHAIENGEPLTEDDRKYALQALRTVEHLAFHGYDAMRVYRQRQQQSGARTMEAVKAIAMMKEAHDAGGGMDEARALIRARKASIDTGHPPLTETINYLRAVYGMTQGKAIKECAAIFDRPVDSVDRHYKRAKARGKSSKGVTPQT